MHRVGERGWDSLLPPALPLALSGTPGGLEQLTAGVGRWGVRQELTK